MPPSLTVLFIIFIVYIVFSTAVILSALSLGSRTERQLDAGGWKPLESDATDASGRADPSSRSDPGRLIWLRLLGRLGMPADRLARSTSLVLLTFSTLMLSTTQALQRLAIPAGAFARYTSAILLIEAAVMVRAMQALRKQR